MSEKHPPCSLQGEDEHKHVLGEIPKIPTESVLPWKVEDRYGALYEAYKKHSTELRSIEDSENKTLLLILAIFGAGATAVSKINLMCQWTTAVYFTLLAGSIVAAGHHVVHENHDLRIAVRDLLVKCEQAMQFYTPNIFLKDQELYQVAERHYACKGQGKQNFSRLIIYLTGIGLVMLIWHNFFNGPPK